jgi:NADH:ubiquinone oxidoreductase subunit E
MKIGTILRAIHRHAAIHVCMAVYCVLVGNAEALLQIKEKYDLKISLK